MIQHHEKYIVQCSSKSIFAAIIDIESYPEFVPGCHDARILSREQDLLIVEQQFGIGPMVWKFSSRAIYKNPEEVIIYANDDPFKSLEIHWKLANVGEPSCEVELLVQANFANLLVQNMVKSLLAVSARNIISVFELRACLYQRNELELETELSQSLFRKPI